MTAPCDLIEIHEAYKRGDLETLKALLSAPWYYTKDRG
jgi:hypothetical protein